MGYLSYMNGACLDCAFWIALDWIAPAGNFGPCSCLILVIGFGMPSFLCGNAEDKSDKEKDQKC
jgi:hypothetical protein